MVTPFPETLWCGLKRERERKKCILEELSLILAAALGVLSDYLHVRIRKARLREAKSFALGPISE